MTRKILSLLLIYICSPLAFANETSAVHLTQAVEGNTSIVPRKVAVLYDLEELWTLNETRAVRFLAMPLENMGYNPVYYDVSKSLPVNLLSSEYAGVVMWLSSNSADQKQDIRTWLLDQIHNGIHVAIIDSLGFSFDASSLRAFGLKVSNQKKPSKLTIVHQSKEMGFETLVLPSKNDFIPIKAENSNIWLRLKSDQGESEDAAAITPWGGYVLWPYALRLFPKDAPRWVVSPFDFLREALRLSSFPQPDVTTENGRRLMLAHIDGDGFVSGAEWLGGTFAGKDLKEMILDQYQIPTTVSIIQGELSSSGKVTENNKQFIEAARDIFRLPWVEIASHTYSHPFIWQELEEKKIGKNLNMQTYDYSNVDVENLAMIEGGNNVEKFNIPKYKFDARKEIQGSADFIDSVLAPKGKKTKVLLWSGDCDPGGAVVKEAYNAGLYNMNFGDTILFYDKKSLTGISPLGANKDGYYQVFAPNQNENVYTNYWTGPFYGYERVIETFELTDKPYRYKPIDIYYHFYSVTKKSGYKALERVYDWALSQKVMNIFASEYAQKVLDWRKTSIAQKGGGWLIRENGSVREMRVDQSMGYPNLKKSRNVIGYTDINDQRYIHLGPAIESFLVFQATEPQSPYLLEANAVVTKFVVIDGEMHFRFKGHMPVTFTMANMESCKVKVTHWWQWRGLGYESLPDYRQRYTLDERESDELRIVC